MEFRILGPLEVLEDGRALDVGGVKQRALLAVLLLHANRVVSTDRLIEALWGERLPETAQKALQVYVSQLRKALGRDRIVTRLSGYELIVEPGQVDVHRFQALVSQGKVDEALSLWRGQPLADFAYEAFAQTEIARLDELRLAALERRAETELAAGRHEGLIGELEGLVQQHPLRERLCGQLMLALYRSGRQAEALEAYQRTRRTLVDQLGIEPGPALRELEHKILNQDDSLAAPRSALDATRAAWPRLVALLGAAVVLGAAAAIAFLATRTSSGLNGIPPNAVGVVDPGSNRIVAAIPVGIRPGPVAAGAGSVWVGNLQDRNLTRIAVRERATAATVSLDNRTPTGIAVGAGAVWVAHGLRGELSRVDPQFGQITRTVKLTDRASTGSVTVGAGNVWAAYGDSTLSRIQPNSMRRAGSALTGSIPAALVVAGGDVWVANSGDATVQRFDTATFEEGPIRAISVGGRPAAIAYGEGALWVANRADDTVTRIDPRTYATQDIPVGDEPAGVAVGAGAVWVANSGDATVSRLDPVLREVVRTIDVANPPAGIAVADGVVWVAVQAP